MKSKNRPLSRPQPFDPFFLALWRMWSWIANGLRPWNSTINPLPSQTRNAIFQVGFGGFLFNFSRDFVDDSSSVKAV